MNAKQGISQRAFTAAEVRKLDDTAINQEGIPGILLMRRAGEVTFQRLIGSWPHVTKISVLCGAGNNAGDGYIIAGIAAKRGLTAEVRWVVSPDRLQGDAKTAWLWAIEQGVDIEHFTRETSLIGEVIVDALLGTGLSGNVRDTYLEPIAMINAANRPIVAVDVPSGLNADTGRVMGSAVNADLTVTFIGLKRGLFTGEGKEYAGELYFDDLGVPQSIYNTVPRAVDILDLDRLVAELKPRSRNSHKGDYGHLLLVGGDHGMPGSIMMASAAATRVGTGLVSVASRTEHTTPLVTNRPEVMVHGVNSGQEFEPLLDGQAQKYQAIVIGPGLGQSGWSQQMMQVVLRYPGPMVIDADGLNLLAQLSDVHRENWVLTPHPGEAGRLLGVTTGDVQRDRFAAAEAIQKKYGGVVLLKGAGTLIADKNGIALCPYGNPGMASGGMGDVLTGVIGGLMAQGLTTADATRLGACLHARAADLQATRHGEIGLLATDLYDDIRGLLNLRSME